MARYFGPNEWFVLIGLVAGYLLVIFLPNRLPRSVSALILLLGMAIPLSLDHSIGVPPFDVYDTNIDPKITFTDLLTWLMYPPFSYLFVYFYDRWNVRGAAVSLYVLVWSLFSTVFEALAVVCGVFEYKHWSLHDSFLIYVIVQLLTAAIFRGLMREHRRLQAS